MQEAGPPGLQPRPSGKGVPAWAEHEAAQPGGCADPAHVGGGLPAQPGWLPGREPRQGAGPAGLAYAGPARREAAVPAQRDAPACAVLSRPSYEYSGLGFLYAGLGSSILAQATVCLPF
jgi:hypothetical protein